MAKNVPGFLCIGAQKAGTSWLQAQFVRHPDVWVPPVKELHYFDRTLDTVREERGKSLSTTSPLARLFGSSPSERARTMEGLGKIRANLRDRDFEALNWNRKWYFGTFNDRWYRSLFRAAEPFATCGEITPRYGVLSLDLVKRIRDVNPDIRIIYLLRDPVQRSWSALRFFVRNGNQKIDLNSPDALVRKLARSKGIHRHSDYMRTLDIYREVFPDRQILVGFFDALRDRPMEFLGEVLQFLGLPGTVEKDTTDARNVSPPKPMPRAVLETMIENYLPAGRRLADLLGSYAGLWLEAMEAGREFTEVGRGCPATVRLGDD